MTKGTADALRVEVSVGELLDKITILHIKSERITNPEKLRHVHTELASLERTRSEAIAEVPGLAALVTQLKSVNEALWQIEEDIRRCERDADFGPTFIALARAVYIQNDQRAALKKQINELLGSRLVEEKEYSNYLRPA